MILTALIVAAVAGGLLATFWEDIKDWLGTIVKKAMQAVKAAVIGAKIFIKKMKEAFEEIAKTYQRDAQGQWHQTTITKKIPESEVPPEIRAKAQSMYQEVDISHELERELKLVM